MTKYLFKEENFCEKGFSEYFEKEIVPVINDLENKRVNYVRTFLITGGVCIIVTLITFFIITALMHVENTTFFMTMSSCLVFSFVILFLIYNNFEELAQTEINEKLVRFFGDFKYTIGKGININIIGNIEYILPDYYSIEYDDSIKGMYNNNLIEFSEVVLVKRYHHGQSYSERVEFGGLFLLITFDNFFPGKTLIIRDPEKYEYEFERDSSFLVNVKFSEKEFEEYFEVYSTEPQQLKQLLNNELQQRLLDLLKNFGSEGLDCIFHRNKAFFAIEYEPDYLGSISLFKPVYKESRMKKFLNDFDMILTLADYLSKQLADLNIMRALNY